MQTTMKVVTLALAAAALSAGTARANVLPRAMSLTGPPPIEAASLTTIYNATFEQYIDHKNPQLGTFSQQYYWSDEFWGGPGSPIVFFTPGEEPADVYTGYLTNRTITGLFAEAIDAAVVMLEHRYYGNSSPFQELTTNNLQYLNLPNAIADITNFANNVDLPFDTTGSSKASKAPWVFSGGSYSGALSAWTQSTAPGTFWAYHASSAPVEAISNYWQYFDPVKQGMPQNCSNDVSLVVNYIDNVLTHGSAKEKQSLKDQFGFGPLQDDDFASALENGPWLWQSNQFYTGYSAFYEFCDYVEDAVGSTGPTPSAKGVGLQKALAGYADWSKNVLIPGYCAGYGYSDWSSNSSLGCFDTHNASSPMYTDLSVNNAINRQWNWFVCDEFGWWQDGAPTTYPSIVSRLVTPQYWLRQCGLFFPRGPEGETYGANKGYTPDDVNVYTKGWATRKTERLWYTNGEFDPWRSASVSSEFRPGGPMQSTEETPIMIVPDGIHCSDLLASNGAANPGVQAVIDAEIKQIKAWVAEYYDK